MSGIAGLGWGELSAVLAIFLVGGVIKGALGFGLPLTTISLLPLVIPVEMALAVNALVQPVSNLGQVIGSGAARAAAARFWPLLPALAVGAGLGTVLLSGLPPDLLLTLLGGFVMLFSAISLGGVVLAAPPPWERPVGLATAGVAGVVGALTTAPGPIFVMYLLGLRLDRALYRATLGLLFLANGGLLVGGFWAVGVLDGQRAVLAGVCLLPAFAGMWGGVRLARRLPAEGFRKAVLGGLLCLGAAFVLRGVGVVSF